MKVAVTEETALTSSFGDFLEPILSYFYTGFKFVRADFAFFLGLPS